jgi:hypothetical protein
MKTKKFFLMALAFVMFCAVAGFVFAEGEAVTYTSSTVTVRNTNKKGRIDVTVCVTLKNKDSGKTVESNWFFDDIAPGQKKDKQNKDENFTIVGASSIMCSSPKE